MNTWDAYKEHVRTVDTRSAKDIDEAEEVSTIITTVIKTRTALGMTQRDLAAACGLPQSSVARIESHRTTPTLSTLLRLIRPLGLQLSVASAS